MTGKKIDLEVWLGPTCQDGRHGEKSFFHPKITISLFIGPGTTEENPAASCPLLLKKYKTVPDGLYWFQGRTAKKYCGRKGNQKFWNFFFLLSNEILKARQKHKSVEFH